MKELSGVIPAVPTPLDRYENVDIDGLRRVLDHVIEQGASAVFVLGSMGEGPALLDEQKKIVVQTAVKQVGGRVPVLAAISDVSTRRTLEMGKQLQELGPDYLVATTPFFFSFPHGDSIKEFVDRLAENLSTPLVFYNVPSRTGNRVSLETLEYIMKRPQVAAIKDSSCDLPSVVELLRRYPRGAARPCRILQGDESVYDVSLLLGADGVVTGGGTCFIPLLAALYQAALKGDRPSAFKLQQEFRKKMDDMLGPELAVDWVHAVKKTLSRRGLCSDQVTSPFLRRR
ncbi:MAG TPA: dihydrodipicolinate synthase family protein [bacterium]|nr:dihydrodipicolinate synthase family protein [bacterium]